MNFEIIPIDFDIPGSVAAVYTVQLEGYDRNEFQIFDEDHYGAYPEDVDLVILEIQDICITGIENRKFRHEGRILALPKEPSNLRLYCDILTPNILFIFNGGYKDVSRYQDDSNLLAIVRKCETIMDNIKSAVNLDIEINGTVITGDLKIERR